MAYQTDFYHLPFTSSPPTVMHIDINSCFATIEQQANPFLRGKPVAVAAYASPNGCILAPSIEAKTYGVKTGMRVRDGQALCPRLIILSPDPWKYRVVHLGMRKILKKYTNDFAPKSIDEFVLHLAGFPAYEQGLVNVAKEIKKRIREEIGEWMSVSVGIAPNRFLAKVAAGVKKPDGLIEINKNNFLEVYKDLKVTDLYGIADKNELRLKRIGIGSVVDFYNADVMKLRIAFRSIGSYYWYTRLRGYEIDHVEFARRTYGNSYSLPKAFSDEKDLAPILCKLTEKMSGRLRRAGYKATGVHVAIRFKDWQYWHHGVTFPRIIFEAREIYKYAYSILCSCPIKAPVGNIAVSCFGLVKTPVNQLDMFEDVPKKQAISDAVDTINKRWGIYTISSARMAETGKYVPDRIAFGNVKELEEFTAVASN